MQGPFFAIDILLANGYTSYMFKLNPILEAWMLKRDEPKKYRLPKKVKRLKIVNNTPVPSATKTLEYKTWSNMKARCCNPKVNGYRYYGGKGIKVCDRWLKNFQAFVNDMGPRPSVNHSIDRIDSNKGYEPSNCRWTTKSQNSARRVK